MTDPSIPVVYIVDDESEVRTTLSRALEMRGYTVQTFASAEEFLTCLDAGTRGCLVLDYGMPEMNGLQLQKELNERKAEIPIVFLSGHAGVPESVQAMKGGAVDFIQKPFRQKQLVACIEDAFLLDANRREQQDDAVYIQEMFDRLTTREAEISKFIVSNPSHTTSKHIGREFDISPRTVDHHRARILEKLEITSVAELIDLATRLDKITP